MFVYIIQFFNIILSQVSEMLQTFKFYVLYMIVLTMSLALLAGTELYKELAQNTIADDRVSSITLCYFNYIGIFLR